MKYVAQGCIGLGLYLLLFLAFLHLIGIIDFHWPGKAEQSAPKEPTAESDRPALELESASVQIKKAILERSLVDEAQKQRYWYLFKFEFVNALKHPIEIMSVNVFDVKGERVKQDWATSGPSADPRLLTHELSGSHPLVKIFSKPGQGTPLEQATISSASSRFEIKVTNRVLSPGEGIRPSGYVLSSKNKYDALTLRVAYQVAGNLREVSHTFNVTPLENRNSPSGKEALQAKMATGLTWTSTSAPPITMTENAVVAHNSRLYLIGGWGPGNKRFKTVYSAVINPDKTLGSWTETTALPVVLADHAAMAYNGHLYVIGGHDGSGFCVRTVYFASFQTNGAVGAWRTTTALPVGNCYSTAIVHNKYLLVVGGQTSTNPSSRSASVYRAAFQADGTLGMWGTTTSLPEAMTSYGSAVVDKGWLYVLGGHTYSTYAAQLDADAQLGLWKGTTPLPSTMNLMWATGRAAINGTVYAIAGGEKGESKVYQATASNGSLGSWTAAASISSELVAPAVTTYNGVVYVIGGRWETRIQTFYSVQPKGSGTM